MQDILTEITPLEDSQVLYLRDSEKEIFSFPLHQHRELEINFIENCPDGTRIVGDSIEPTSSTELVLIGSNLEHAWEMAPDAPPCKMREVTIQFSPDLIGKDLLGKEHFRPIRELLHRAERGIVFGSAAIMHSYTLLNELAAAPKGFYRYIRLLELLHVLAGEEDCHQLSSEQFARSGASADTRRIRGVIDYISAHFREEVRLPELAEKTGMTPTAFSRYFSKHTGKSLTDYLVDMRIGYAARQLAETADTIAEICYDSGFATLSNFNRIFRQRKGCSPKEFRAAYHRRKTMTR